MASVEEIYNQVIKNQRDYLVKLQDAFNKHCDEIATQTNQKLALTPETDTENRKKIFDEQKKLLDEALTQLRNEVNRSSTEVRHKLEELHGQKEQSFLQNLENDIKSL